MLKLEKHFIEKESYLLDDKLLKGRDAPGSSSFPQYLENFPYAWTVVYEAVDLLFF